MMKPCPVNWTGGWAVGPRRCCCLKRRWFYYRVPAVSSSSLSHPDRPAQHVHRIEDGPGAGYGGGPCGSANGQPVSQSAAGRGGGRHGGVCGGIPYRPGNLYGHLCNARSGGEYISVPGRGDSPGGVPGGLTGMIGSPSGCFSGPPGGGHPDLIVSPTGCTHFPPLVAESLPVGQALEEREHSVPHTVEQDSQAFLLPVAPRGGGPWKQVLPGPAIADLVRHLGLDADDPIADRSGHAVRDAACRPSGEGEIDGYQGAGMLLWGPTD